MLVESPDGERCLLGMHGTASPSMLPITEANVAGQTKRRHKGKMFSCLAGFVEQCESVEDAVRREVWEESGITVGEVQIVGSQPWPVGAAGHCELMLGCVARAVSCACASGDYSECASGQQNEDLNVDKEEMEDVR